MASKSRAKVGTKIGTKAQAPSDERMLCRTPTPGKQPTRIPKWKYDVVRKAVLKAVPKRGDGVAAKDLKDLVRPHLTAAQLDELGSLGWHVTTVKLNMEVEGELVRVANATPQRLLRR